LEDLLDDIWNLVWIHIIGCIVLLFLILFIWTNGPFTLFTKLFTINLFNLEGVH
jgi:hypothetical protein